MFLAITQQKLSSFACKGEALIWKEKKSLNRCATAVEKRKIKKYHLK